MAYLVKAEKTYSSPLAKADFGRQRDIYKLALMGSGDCRRLWNEYAAECPGNARLVIADVQSDQAESAQVSKSLDKRLVKAEKLVTKSGKPKKVTKSAKVTEREKYLRQIVAVSENSFEREGARQELYRMYGNVPR